MAGSAVVGRVAGIASVFVSDEKRSERLLKTGANRVLRQLGGLLGGLGRMENWLRHRGRADLAACDRSVLTPSFQRLTRDARTVAELVEDLLTEIDLP